MNRYSPAEPEIDLSWIPDTPRNIHIFAGSAPVEVRTDTQVAQPRLHLNEHRYFETYFDQESGTFHLRPHREKRHAKRGEETDPRVVLRAPTDWMFGLVVAISDTDITFGQPINLADPEAVDTGPPLQMEKLRVSSYAGTVSLHNTRPRDGLTAAAEHQPLIVRAVTVERGVADLTTTDSCISFNRSSAHKWIVRSPNGHPVLHDKITGWVHVNNPAQT